MLPLRPRNIFSYSRPNKRVTVRRSTQSPGGRDIVHSIPDTPRQLVAKSLYGATLWWWFHCKSLCRSALRVRFVQPVEPEEVRAPRVGSHRATLETLVHQPRLARDCRLRLDAGRESKGCRQVDRPNLWILGDLVLRERFDHTQQLMRSRWAPRHTSCQATFHTLRIHGGTVRHPGRQQEVQS